MKPCGLGPPSRGLCLVAAQWVATIAAMQAPWFLKGPAGWVCQPLFLQSSSCGRLLAVCSSKLVVVDPGTVLTVTPSIALDPGAC